MTCKLIGVTQGQWESASALDLHLWLNLTRILGRVLLSISLVHFKVEPSCKHSRRTKTTTQQLISCFTTTSASFLFQSDKILMTFTPSLLPFHLPPSPPPLHPAEPPPVLFCGFPFARSLAPFFFFFLLNWNSSLWNGKVIYIDSKGIWLAVLSGATCNVTGNNATVNILPPTPLPWNPPVGQPVTSNRNLEMVRVFYEAIVRFGGNFFTAS